MQRRLFVSAGLGVLGARGASASEPYPSKPVKWVVPYPAGAFTDAAARLIGERLSARLGQQFVIENKTGAGAIIGTEAVVNAPPDGYTLLFISTANVINTSLYKKLPFDFRRDILPVAGLVRMPQLIVVNPAVPATTTAEFIAYCKANPGKVNMASAGLGTGNHLAGEIFQSMTGTKLTHVPYRGTAPAMAALISGQVQVIFDNVATSLAHIRAGKIRAIGTTTKTRLPLLPDVPPVADTLPGYEAISFYGIGVPKGTPAEIVDKLNREVNLAMADPKIEAFFTALGTLIALGSPAEFGALMDSEGDKWAAAVKAAGVSLD
ncbi:MAG: tripartite tricarboxylate transporter substrate binding protein [Alphaproteobacteria bacterium]|nr:tripartite tricarboxylate transporter substrate binding protein [Alphaproteobacteria bacterium]